MDSRKLNIPTLMGPNWGSYESHLQAVVRILDYWDILKGEAWGTMSQTYNFVVETNNSNTPRCKRMCSGHGHLDKKELRCIQGTISPTIWVDYVKYSSTKAIWGAPVTRFRKVGGRHRPPSR